MLVVQGVDVKLELFGLGDDMQADADWYVEGGAATLVETKVDEAFRAEFPCLRDKIEQPLT